MSWSHGSHQSVRYAVGNFGGSQCYALAADDQDLAGDRLSSVPVRSLFSVLDEALLNVVGRSMAVVEFQTTHRFCGRCAIPIVPLAGERGKACPRCNLSFHLRIPPAVITLIEHEGRLLLALSARFKTGMFSALAGFVEMGESLEEAAGHVSSSHYVPR